MMKKYLGLTLFLSLFVCVSNSHAAWKLFKRNKQVAPLPQSGGTSNGKSLTRSSPVSRAQGLAASAEAQRLIRVETRQERLKSGKLGVSFAPGTKD
jgi:hypothetical protein